MSPGDDDTIPESSAAITAVPPSGVTCQQEFRSVAMKHEHVAQEGSEGCRLLSKGAWCRVRLTRSRNRTRASRWTSSVGTADDVVCWFVEISDDAKSLFVRLVYVTGADEPYEKLKRALKAEIDEAAWATLYSTVSRPFAAPATGKIAVKVINHYSDEVLKVYEVG